MQMQAIRQGDAVSAVVDIHNDGSHPEHAENAAIAVAGTRGMLVRIGQVEDNPEIEVYLVRFERRNDAGTIELGPPVGCWREEIQAVAE